MTSITGHLTNYTFGDQIKKLPWNSFDPFNLFSKEVYKQVDSDKHLLKSTLEELARKNSHLLLWLDCDREGENIANEVVDVCLNANPNQTVLRAHFSAMTTQNVTEEMLNLTPPNQRLSDSVDVRQVVDLKSGEAITR